MNVFRLEKEMTVPKVLDEKIPVYLCLLTYATSQSLTEWFTAGPSDIR